jgi:hypothetical protein
MHMRFIHAIISTLFMDVMPNSLKTQFPKSIYNFEKKFLHFCVNIKGKHSFYIQTIFEI